MEEIPGVQFVDLSAESWIRFIETQTDQKIHYEDSLVEGLSFSFNSNGSIDSERLKSALLLFLELEGVEIEKIDDHLRLVRSATAPLEAEFVAQITARLPEGWLESPEKIVEGIELNDLSARHVTLIIGDLAGLEVIQNLDKSISDKVAFRASGGTNHEIARSLISLLEERGYRFLLKDRFLLVSVDPGVFSARKVETEEPDAEAKERIKRIAEEFRKRRDQKTEEANLVVERPPPEPIN